MATSGRENVFLLLSPFFINRYYADNHVFNLPNFKQCGRDSSCGKAVICTLRLLYNKCKESKKWREEWINSNWSNINEDLVYKKIICCTSVNRIKLLGKYLFKVKYKWKNKVRGDLNPPPQD
jgi:hypothetical protein